MKQKQEDIQAFITETFLFGRTDIVINATDSFLDKGIIDSTGVLELVTFLESKYGITIKDEELTPENLDSISNVLRFLQAKLQTVTPLKAI